MNKEQAISSDITKKEAIRLLNTIVSKNDILEAKNSELAMRISNLEFQIAQFQRMINGAKSERFISKDLDGVQLDLFNEISPEAIEKAIETEMETISYERAKKRKAHPGRMELPKHLPVVETILEPSEDVTNMKHIGNEITDELEYTPAKLFVNRIIRPKYISQEDEKGNQHQVIAELNRPINKCIAGSSLLTSILINKFIFHLPLYRQLQMFKLQDVEIPSSTVDSWMRLVAKHLHPLFVVHREHILANQYLQADESPIKVQDKDKKGVTHQGYMWVYRAPLQNALFFDYNKGRGSVAPTKHLINFSGYLQTDGYAVYEQFAKKTDITHLVCNAHARRYFEKAIDNDKEKASYVLLLFQKLYAIERNAKESNISAEDRHALRIEKSLPIFNKMGKYITDNSKSVLPKSPIGKAFVYCINHWDAMMNYLKDGNLEIDNNLIENSIRPLALGRKNYLFAGSHDAAQEIAMYYSFFGTCKQHDINPEKWLKYVIDNINDTKMSNLKKILPQFIDKNLIN